MLHRSAETIFDESFYLLLLILPRISNFFSAYLHIFIFHISDVKLPSIKYGLVNVLFRTPKRSVFPDVVYVPVVSSENFHQTIIYSYVY